MTFFTYDRNKKTEDLKLSEHDQIWTKFCFLDETGSLNSPNDPYFTVGVIKMSQPYYLQSKILYERNIRNFHDEMKFNKLSKKNVDFAKFTLGAFLDTKSISFYSYTTKKDSWYFKKHFRSDQWIAYEMITLKLLDAALAEHEILMLIADHVTVPKEVRFEVNTKKNFNCMKKRLALAGVCRFDSRANDLLQVVDLLIGGITYDLKLEDKIVPGSKEKIEISKFLKDNLGTNSFKSGFKNRNFSIFVENGEDNEKGRSS
jgi:hypothetical protein